MKRARLRLSVLLLALAFFVLVDEALKEGYVFDPTDLVVPRITHEKLFLALLLLGLVLGLRLGGGRTRDKGGRRAGVVRRG